MTRSSSRTAIVVFILFGALLTACGSSRSSESAKPVIGGTLVDYATLAIGTPDTLDPAISYDVSATQVDDLLFDGLTAIDEHGNVTKQVASDYSSSDNATIWNFTLRSDVKFSDGSPVLPSSFKRGWERALNPALNSKVSFRVQQLASTPDATTLDNVTVDDQKRTLTIKLSSPQSNIPAVLSSAVFSPAPANVPNDDSWGSTLMVGNGPYKLDAPYQPHETLKLVRNANYAGSGEKAQQPYLDAIEFHSFSDADAAYKEFAAGKGDLALFPQSAAADLQKYQKGDVIAPPLLAVEGFGFNMNSPIYGGDDNLKLRQAIDAAIDKSQINAEVYAGTHQVASQFSPAAVPGAEPKATDGKPDVEKAKQLLADWGKTPPQLKVSYPNAFDGKLENIVVDNLKAIGISAVADPEPADSFFQDVGAGKFDVFLFQWTADYPSYQAMLEPTFDSKNIGSTDLFSYKNDQVDGLFEKAIASSSVDESNDYYRQAEQKVLADQPYVPVDWATDNVIKNSYVHDVSVDPLGKIDYSRVWLSPKTAAKTS